VVADKFELRPDHRYIISVGSVGQPRDGNPRSAYVTLDTETRMFEFHRVEYDIDGAADKIREADLSPSFADRLFIGF
jgi:diadenosine tetraphosphatase ApaH/serine/threonine PP2A family protein phosphatase